MRRVRRPLIALIALVVALVIGYVINGIERDDHNEDRIHTVSLTSLPPQAAQTVKLIQHGGPYPYPGDDGVVFHNYEGLLPKEPDGYYHEYTVPTPGSPDRGARRIVTGKPYQYWYTGDHYGSFERVDVKR